MAKEAAGWLHEVALGLGKHKLAGEANTHAKRLVEGGFGWRLLRIGLSVLRHARGSAVPMRVCARAAVGRCTGADARPRSAAQSQNPSPKPLFELGTEPWQLIAVNEMSDDTEVLTFMQIIGNFSSIPVLLTLALAYPIAYCPCAPGPTDPAPRGQRMCVCVCVGGNTCA